MSEDIIICNWEKERCDSLYGDRANGEWQYNSEKHNVMWLQKQEEKKKRKIWAQKGNLRFDVLRSHYWWYKSVRWFKKKILHKGT